MINYLFFKSPLEQFSVISLVEGSGNGFTNLTLYLFFFSLLVLMLMTWIGSSSVFLLSPVFSFFMEFFIGLKGIVCNQSGICNFFFNWFSSLTLILLLCNVFGLLPFSFTVTTHFVVTLSISFFFFFWINAVFFFRFFIEWGTLFLPSGTPISILFLIVPIEVLSYFSRLLSLAIRLFANMMSGHTLLVILGGFLFNLLTLNFLIIFPVIILHLIFLMEIGVAFLQVYVFIVLSTLYLQDTSSATQH